MSNLIFGAGIWMFQQFVDRYATDAYGPPVGTLEAIEKAATVGDIKVLDINYPFAGDGVTVKQVREALERTYRATPDPKWVVAVGDCALDGGIFAGSYAVIGGVSNVVPVDLHIRGCPPSPNELLKGLITVLEQVSK